ncbi:XRE family transcriptional regulator [Frigidibacter sp. RF13]|uniref:helix-turn-helix domain-containing protein n=1 Tax=Frigidibacter sp. RF13 TaxID=2997340 RepID=UPI0022705BFD|nr:XRE family transcriptional regulator [Frigidibacter sp. RF13]MCY1128103.1 XRE family transcriptional regulator [Frigidibacter sp. RF13]
MPPLTDRPRQTEAHEALAARIRRWREVRGWNQQALADRAGFARSTLSKIENGLLSPTFEILLKIARGFGCDLSDLVRPEAPRLAGRLVIERGLPGEPVEDAKNRLWPLGAQIKGRGFQAMIVEFTETDIDAFGPWNRHETDDMLHVLSGRLALHTEGYETAVLGPGDTVHFDGAMPHACLSAGPEVCRCLYVFAERDGALPDLDRQTTG